MRYSGLQVLENLVNNAVIKFLGKNVLIEEKCYDNILYV